MRLRRRLPHAENNKRSAFPALSIVLALIAMIFVPVTAANAAPGDLAHGVVRSDANKDNAITSAAIGEDDRGLAGVTVNALDAGGNIVATTTTAADGSWSILEADAAGAVSIEILSDTANGNVYATHPSTSGDNDFARAGAPNRATAAITAADAELNALVYPVWKLDAQLADDPDGVDGKSIITGTPNFDANDSEPGNDSGTTNTRVRSSDIVAFNWTLTAESEDGSLGDSFENAVFEQTITLVDGAVANFAAIPAVCETGSKITALPSGAVIAAKIDPPVGTTSVTLTCVLGGMGVAPSPSAIILSTQVQPSAASPNGSSFDTDARFYGVDANGAATAQPVPGPEVPPIDITAAPRYDVEKFSNNSTYTGTYNIPGVGPTFGYMVYYTVQISTDRKVGVEAPKQPITIEESFWGNRTVTGPDGEIVGSNIGDLKWYIDLCDQSVGGVGGQLPARTVYGRPGRVPDANASNSVRDSGTCAIARTGAPDTGNYTLTFDNIDTSGLSYPTQTAGGQSLAAGPYYVASYRVRVFIPATEIDRMQGAADDGIGELAVFNRIGNFDPEGVSGTSNFGSGVEPGYCDAGPTSDQSDNCDEMEDTTRSNNVAGPLTVRMGSGSWAKYLVDKTSGWTGGFTNIPEVTTSHSGTGQVQPGQTFSSFQNFTNTGIDMSFAEMCDVFDNRTLKLAPLNQDVSASGPYPDGLYSAMVLLRAGLANTVANQQAHQANWVTKYGVIDLGSDNANTGVFDLSQNRYEGDWTNQRLATTPGSVACADPDMTWYDDPNDAPGGVDAVNVVWVHTAPGYVVRSGDTDRWFLAFEQRDTYNGGPNAGQSIPAGTVAANYGNVRTSTFAQNWTAAAYVPGSGGTLPLPAGVDRQPGETGSGQGDRWTVSRAVMRLQKHTVAGQIAGEAASGVSTFGVTGAAVAGKPVIWEIVSTLTATSDEPAPVENVVITDVLPNYVVYDEAGTVALAAEHGFPMPTSVTLNGDGTTTLVWNLGTRTPNQDLPVLKIATYTDAMAPPNTTAINNAEITATGIVPVAAHRDDHTIRIEQSGQVQLKKSVDRTLDLQNGNQQYTLELKNFSEMLAIQAPTVYDALPYNGDATNAANVNRTPASDYAGTNRLHAAPQAFDFDGTTPRAGTFYYTTVPGAEVPQRQQDDTNPAIWSTTFTANATGFKFVASSPLTTTANASKSGIKITFQTDQAANDPGDLYTNRFTAISPTLNGGNQLLTSNTVSVRVIGFSLGDFIWFDVNANGKFDAGTDRPAPEGVTVQVRTTTGGIVATTATLGGDQQGRWVVNNLAKGDYYVTIPASEFAAGGKLAGALPAPNPVADPNTDANEDTDHHAIADGAGVRSSGVISLGADESADPIAGDEPTGDNVAGLALAPLTTDDFTNLTLDLALRPSTTFTVAKAIDGDGAQYHADTEFDIEVTCTLNGVNVAGYPKTVTLTGGESVELSAPMGANCAATETDDGGATETAIDPANGVTLVFEPADPITITVTNTFTLVEFTVSKIVDGNGAHLHADTEFAITVDCTVDGSSWRSGEAGGFPQEITLTGSESETFTAPVGANCTAVETDTAGATEASVDPEAGILLTDDPDAAFAITVTNTFEVGSFKIVKEATGVGAGIKDSYSFEFGVVCTYRGAEVLNETAILTGDGTTNLESDQFDDLPVGSECVITETASDGADETPGPVQITIDRDPETVQLAGFVNEYSAGTIEVTKALDGAAADDTFVKDLVFDVAVTCQVDVNGTIVDVYSGVLKVKGGEIVAPEIDGEPVLVPLGSHCFGAEPVTQGAASATVDYDSYDNAAVVEAGNVDEPQLLTLTAVNTFDNASLTVSKTVVGPDLGESYNFELVCTYPVTGEDGTVTQTVYPLAEADARFTLKGGESRTIEVLAGVDCGVVETDAPAGATVTYLDSDETTPGGETDGQVGSLAGTENTVGVTNTLELAKLTVSKTVVGPGPEGAQYGFELVCTYHGTDGDVPFPLDPEDASFTLKHGESRTIEVLAGVDCEVTETDARGARVTILDTDDSTGGGVKDGVVADLHGDGNTVEVTNTFEKLAVTGGAQLTTVVLVAALLLLTAGGALIVVGRV